jgi:hypothetical protein
MAKVENASIFDINKQAIEKEINAGMEIVAANYTLKEIGPGEFARLRIQNMEYDIKQYEIVGVGNLLVMDSRDSPSLQMVSFVITPYYKNLPLFSTDYLYTQQKITFLIEYYDLVQEKDRLYNSFIDRFRAIKDKHRSLPDMELKKCWYDSMRSVCTAKTTSVLQDEEIFAMFTENLKAFIEMEQAYGPLAEDARTAKWRITQDYVDGLVDAGGVSTDVFKAVLGPEKTKAFFNKVFFGTARFRGEWQ